MPTADFTFEDARDRLRRATEVVIAAERAVEVAGEEAADAEGVYRAELATAFKAEREAGAAVEAASIAARGACVVFSRERDAKATALKLAFEKLEDARDSRRSLWRLIEWARARDGARSNAPENAPGDRWP
jgi:hypothetical protein